MVVIALFPTIPGSGMDRYSVQSYQHVGQHGAARLDIIHDTRPATPAEYASLKRELEGAPYHYKLKVCQRATRAMQDKQLAERRR